MMFHDSRLRNPSRSWRSVEQYITEGCTL